MGIRVSALKIKVLSDLNLSIGINIAVIQQRLPVTIVSSIDDKNSAIIIIANGYGCIVVALEIVIIIFQQGLWCGFPIPLGDVSGVIKIFLITLLKWSISFQIYGCGRDSKGINSCCQNKSKK